MGNLTTETSSRKRNRKQIKELLVDCDIHHAVRSYDELKPYLPRTWWERLEEVNANLPVSMFYRAKGLFADDTKTEVGIPGSDPDLAKDQLLDKYDVDIGVLTGSIYGASAHYNPDYGSAMASAFNDYTLDKWIAHDERWRGSIIIAATDPIQAAQEINRLGSHPKMIQVLMTFGSRELYGQRRFYPIYEAAEKHNLPIAIHLGGEGAGINPSVSAAGYPTSNFERHNILPIHAMSHLNSFICEGVFEKFPGLKIVFVESGLAWIPGLLWRMDKNFKGLRTDAPWLKRYPSEYIIDHVRFTSQPIEEPNNYEHLLQLFDMIHADKTVMFSTDYPHWDTDDPSFVLKRLPERYKERIAGETARELYRL
ncbi:amidohydrolase [bacterium LRH843]|nr:amidohydrolase [bacterium LRH843]